MARTRGKASAGAEAAAMLQALLDHGPCVVFAIDDQYRILTLNRVPDGLRHADVIGTSCLDHVPADQHATVRHAVAQVLRTGKPAAVEIQARGARETWAWYAARVLPMRRDDGARRLLVVAEDISARRQAEQALRHTRRMLETAVDSMPGLACLIRGSDLRLQFVNRAFQALAPGRPLVGRTLDEIWPDAGIDFAALCRQVLDTGEPRLGEDLVKVQRRRGAAPVTRTFAWALHRVRLPGEDGWGLLNTGVETTAQRDEERRLHHTLKALGESEERLRLALDASGEGLWDWNLVTDEVHYSPAFFTMLGHAPETMAPHVDSAVRLMHPSQREASVAQVRRLLHEPGHFVMRFRMRSAGGGYRWIESRGKTVRWDADGHPVRAVGTHVDVTERVQLADALARSEARLRAIVDSTSDLVHVKDTDGRYVLVNRALCQFAGLQATDILGRDDTAFLPAGTVQAVMAQDRQVMDGGEVVTLELAVTNAAGEPRTLHATKGPLRDDQGTVVGVFGIARDLTDRLRQEEAHRQALEEGRERLAHALAGSDLGTWDQDLVSGRARRDDRYLAMIGYAPGELEPTTRAWEELLHPDDREPVLAAIRAHERGDTAQVEIEYRLRHREGHWVWVLGRGKMTRNAQGHAVRATGTVMDISRRKRVVTEGAALLQQLEALLTGRGGRADPTRRDSPGAVAPATALSPRSREVLELVALGLTAAEIATRLGIARDTADTHRRNLMRKLGLRNKAELIRYAMAHGIGRTLPVDPDR